MNIYKTESQQPIINQVQEHQERFEDSSISKYKTVDVQFEEKYYAEFNGKKFEFSINLDTRGEDKFKSTGFGQNRIQAEDFTLNTSNKVLELYLLSATKENQNFYEMPESTSNSIVPNLGISVDNFNTAYKDDLEQLGFNNFQDVVSQARNEKLWENLQPTINEINKNVNSKYINHDAELQNSIFSIQSETVKSIDEQIKREQPYSLPPEIKTVYTQKNEHQFYEKLSNQFSFEILKDQKINTPHKDPKTIGHMLAIADSKNWKTISLTGDKAFKQEAWIQANAMGISVNGYSPSKEDKSLLAQRIQEQNKSQNAIIHAKEQVQAVAKAAVMAKVSNPATQDKVLSEITKRSDSAIKNGQSPAIAVYDNQAASRDKPVEIKQQDSKRDRTR